MLCRLLLCRCLQASPGADPDVADQIMQYCRGNTYCQPILELHAQLVATQQRLEAAQQQHAELKQQLLDAKKGAAELRRQLQQRQMQKD